MRVTPPIPITDAQIVSNTVADIHNPAAYNGAITYAFGAIVSVAEDWKIYESLQSSNTGHPPKTSPRWWGILGGTETAYNHTKTDYADKETCSHEGRVYESLVLQTAANPLPVWPEEKTAFWADAGATNKHAMFDANANSQTVAPGSLTVVLTPGMRINTVGLTGLQANACAISATSVFAGGSVFSKTFDLNRRNVVNAYDYAFMPFETNPTAIVFDVPPYSDIVVTIALTATSGNVKCGACVLGTFIELGDVLEGATNDGRNFSTVTRDLYANAKLTKRRTLPTTSQTLFAKAALVNKIKAARVLLNAEPALYSGLIDQSSPYADMLTILGIYTRFLISAINNGCAEINLDLEEI